MLVSFTLLLPTSGLPLLPLLAPIELPLPLNSAPIELKLILLSKKNCYDERTPISANTLAFNVTFHHLSWLNLMPSGGEKHILELFPLAPRQSNLAASTPNNNGENRESEVGVVGPSIANK